MITYPSTGSYSLMRQLSGLEGHWSGEVHSADGTLVGREQVSCRWAAGRTAFQVTSCLVSCAGRVLGAEQADLIYDPRSDSISAVVQQGSGHSDLAHAYANAQNELVLVSDGDLRLRRFSWPVGGDPAAPARDTWHYRLEVATDEHLTPQWLAILYRV